MKVMNKVMVIAAMMVAMAGQAETISFTNRQGRVFTNATVLRTNASRIIIKDESGFAGPIYLTNLPAALQKRYGYDPVEATWFERNEKEKRQKEAAALAEARQQAMDKEDRKKLRAQMEAQKEIIFGRVIEVSAAGVLVSASDGSDSSGFKTTSEYRRLEKAVSPEAYWKIPRAEGYALLTDFSHEVADGEQFVTVGYPLEVVKYKSYRTVRKYTADLSRWIGE